MVLGFLAFNFFPGGQPFHRLLRSSVIINKHSNRRSSWDSTARTCKKSDGSKAHRNQDGSITRRGASESDPDLLSYHCCTEEASEGKASPRRLCMHMALRIHGFHQHSSIKLLLFPFFLFFMYKLFVSRRSLSLRCRPAISGCVAGLGEWLS